MTIWGSQTILGYPRRGCRASLWATLTVLAIAPAFFVEPLSAAPSPPAAPSATKAVATKSAARTTVVPPAVVKRTPAEVDAYIQQAGPTPPDWWDSVPLNVPNNVDLVWGSPRGGAKGGKQNLSQFVNSIIQTNPGRWREGAKLLHHALTVNKDDPAALKPIMQGLADLYLNYLADYARAAFWYRKAGVVADLNIARCYWKLGCKELAIPIVEKNANSRRDNIPKIWSDMGETDRAVQAALAIARKPNMADEGCRLAGDACLAAGRYPEALNYYQQGLAAATRDNVKARITDDIEMVRMAQGFDLKRIRDGTWTAEVYGFAAPLEVEVVVKGGRIVSCRVTRHKETRVYSALYYVPNQIVEKQGVKGVDAVTSATITSEAILQAAQKALLQGMK